MMGHMFSNVGETPHKNIGFEATFMGFFNGPRNELSNFVFGCYTIWALDHMYY